MENDLKELSSIKNIHFKKLLSITTRHFGKPRIRGSHHIFKTPWVGRPWLNLQKDGKMAKSYQVKQVKEALQNLIEITKDKYNEK